MVCAVRGKANDRKVPKTPDCTFATIRRRSTVLLITVLLLSASAAAQLWSLDSTFGEGGVVMTPFNQTGSTGSNAVAVQADGKIVADAASHLSGHTEFALVRFLPDGQVDRTFGTNGVATIQVGTSGNDIYSIAVQDDGKIVAGGSGYNGSRQEFALSRFNTDGSVDKSFGTNGAVLTAVGSGYAYAKSIALQRDGKIVATGTSQDGSASDVAVVRFTPNGAVDSSFAVDGMTTFGPTGSIGTYPGDPFAYGANSIAIQGDGKIVVGGYSFFLDVKTFTPSGHFLIIRYDSTGGLDQSFNGGIVLTLTGPDPTPSGDGITSLAIQNDGRIVAAGYALESGINYFALVRYERNGIVDAGFGTMGVTKTLLSGGLAGTQAATLQGDGKIVLAGYSGTLSSPHAFALIRYDTSGALDPQFGANGITTVSVRGAYGEGYGVTLQPGGKILETGLTYDGVTDELAIGRFDSTGALDRSFGINGFVTSSGGNIDDEANALSIQLDGKLLVAGSSSNGIGSVFTVLRYNPDGTPDRFWGSGGVTTAFSQSADAQANALVTQGDGTVIAVGYGNNGKNKDFAVARFTPSGVPDGAFGAGGLIATPIGSSDDIATAVAVQSDGRIVVAGYSLGTYDHFALTRYLTNGTLDHEFGVGGIVQTQVGTSHNFAQAVAVQKDGKILAAGNSLTGGNYQFAVVRYKPDGTPDSAFGNAGVVLTPIETASFGYALAVQGDGRFIVAGYAYDNGAYSIALVRYDSSGALDQTFGSNGSVETRIGSANVFAYSVAIDSIGRIIAGGQVQDGSRYQFTLVRYTANGRVDSTFGDNGILLTHTGISNGYGRSVAIQKDGKIDFAGFSAAPDGSNYKVITLLRYDESAATTGVPDRPVQVPASFVLEQNYPNPFNPKTVISGQWTVNSDVRLEVFDILGREVATLANGKYPAGRYSFAFDGANLASGVYFYRLTVGANSAVRKMLLVR